MLCETRWTVRHGCITAILENYEALQTKEEVNQTTHDDYGRKAGGQLALMEKFSTYFGFCLSKLLFGASEQLSRTLHGKVTAVKESLEAANFYEDIKIYEDIALHSLHFTLSCNICCVNLFAVLCRLLQQN